MILRGCTPSQAWLQYLVCLQEWPPLNSHSPTAPSEQDSTQQCVSQSSQIPAQLQFEMHLISAESFVSRNEQYAQNRYEQMKPYGRSEPNWLLQAALTCFSGLNDEIISNLMALLDFAAPAYSHRRFKMSSDWAGRNSYLIVEHAKIIVLPKIQMTFICSDPIVLFCLCETQNHHMQKCICNSN